MVTVLFRSRLHDPTDAEYAQTAVRMQQLASSMPGFISFRRFIGEQGERLSVIEFETHADVDGWRRHPEHREAQARGRESFYECYELTVLDPVRAYGFADGVRYQKEI